MFDFREGRLSDKDRWIGLHRDNLRNCNCTDSRNKAPTDDCLLCRSRFEWVDGSALEYSNWASHEPSAASDDCVRLTKEHLAGFSCGAKIKFICKKGIQKDFLLYVKSYTSYRTLMIIGITIVNNGHIAHQFFFRHHWCYSLTSQKMINFRYQRMLRKHQPLSEQRNLLQY